MTNPKNLIMTVPLILMLPAMVLQGQGQHSASVSLEDYFNDMAESGDEYLPVAEEWKEAIDRWLESPLNINAEETTILHETGLISRYQWNRLREYRLMYGDLLSVFELFMIDGWDRKSVLRIIPLVIAENPRENPAAGTFRDKFLQQRMVLKTGFTAETRAGYRSTDNGEGEVLPPVYQGSRFRFSLRYDLEYRKRISVGFRMEKDPGEPLMVGENTAWRGRMHLPDHYSGFLAIKKAGPFPFIILGDFQVRFGFGLNQSSGNYGSLSSGGIAGMAAQIRAKTSMQESGYWRGAAVTVAAGRFSFAAYGSSRNIDVSSPKFEGDTGRLISFTGLNASGLHRTATELARRKLVRESLLGGHMLFGNNWLKTGAIVVFSRYNTSLDPGGDLCKRYQLRGRDNLVAGVSGVAYLARWHIFGEGSVSRNKGWALMGGVGLQAAPGADFQFIFRKFSRDYQNLHGSGFISSSRNQDETGARMVFSAELPLNINLNLMMDHSCSRWYRYQMNFPARETRISGTLDKTWKGPQALSISLYYQQRTARGKDGFQWLDRQSITSLWRFRIEGKITPSESLKLKSRVELMTGAKGGTRAPSGWLVFQDFGYAFPSERIRIWFRACLFQAPDYDFRMYAYENDVLYDFSSFMYYGKGSRFILMLNWEPFPWLECWAKYAAVHYTGRSIGTGPEATGGNGLNEFEFQVMIRDLFQ